MLSNNEYIEEASYLISETIQAVLEFRAVPDDDELSLGSAASNLRQNRYLLLTLLNDARQRDIDTILAVEHVLLTMEREYLPEAPIRISSLDKAFEELDATLDMLSIVRDSLAYEFIDRGFSLGKNRNAKNLPHDQAQQFFKSQQTRISNINRGSQGKYVLEILAAREDNLEQARLQYTALQQQALGIDGSSEVQEPAACYAVRLKAA